MEEQLRNVDAPTQDTGTSSILTILRRRIWVIVPTAVIVLVLTGMYALVQPRMYEASTWLLVADTGVKSAAEQFLTEADVLGSMQSDVSMHIRLIKGADIAEQVQEQLATQVPVGTLLTHVAVAKLPGASSNLLSLTYQSQEPAQARDIANAWAKAYEQDSRKRSTSTTVAAIDYVTRQMDTVETDLRQMEEEMAELEQEYLDVGVGVSPVGVASRVSILLDQSSHAAVEIQAVQAQINRTRERLAQEPPEVEEVLEQPSLRAQAIEQQLSQLHIDLQNMLQDYYADSPEVLALQEQIDRLERQLGDGSSMTRSSVTTAPSPVYMNAQDTLIELYGTLDALRARQSALQGQLAERKQLEAMAPEGRIAYSELLRKVAGLQAVHSALLTRLYELQLRRAMVVPPVQLVREAQEPKAPVSPQYPVILAMGLVAAVLLAVFAAVVVDQVDNTFAGPDEIREMLGERLVGVLPELEKGATLELQANGTNGASRSPFTNAMRMLASTVRIEMARENLSSLVVMSSGPSEGKTLTAANLAASLAGAGEKVLLIDADMHRPRMHVLLGVNKAPGLSHLLVSDDPIESVIQPTHVENLSVITAGELPPSPVDLLAGVGGQELITRLGKAADYVIWDTPPAGFLADATIIGHNSDRTLFVVGRQAKRGVALETLTRLREIGVKVLGLCANRVKSIGGSHYYYYQYYGDESGGAG